MCIIHLNNQQQIENQNIAAQQNLVNSNTQNAANLHNQNMGNYTSMANNAQTAKESSIRGDTQYEKNLLGAMLGANTQGLGQNVDIAGQLANNEYQRNWNTAATTASTLATFIPAMITALSDERLKHYKECTKKVTVRSPKSIQSLKMNVKKEL